jgi:hypothetical protein
VKVLFAAGFVSKSKAKKVRAKSTKPKKKSARSLFLKALMRRIDEDLAEAFAAGDVEGFESQFEDLKKGLINKMPKKV